MPYLSTVITARKPAAFKTNLDAWFAANLQVYIRHFQLVAKDQLRFTGLEYRAVILYEALAVAPLLAPFTATILQAPTGAAFATDMAAVIAANPGFLYRGPFTTDLGESRRTEDLVGVLFQTSDAVNGATNWP